MTKLSEEICKRCWDERAEEVKEKRLLWSYIDERRWQQGVVLCRTFLPFGFGPCPIDSIPDGCFYRLEHIVLSEKPK